VALQAVHFHPIGDWATADMPGAITTQPRVRICPAGLIQSQVVTDQIPAAEISRAGYPPMGAVFPEQVGRSSIGMVAGRGYELGVVTDTAGPHCRERLTRLQYRFPLAVAHDEFRVPAVTGNAIHAGVGILGVPDLAEIGVATAATQRFMPLLDEFLEAYVDLTVLDFRAGFFEAGALVAGDASPVGLGENILAGVNRQGEPTQAHGQRQKAREIGSNPVQRKSPHTLTTADQKMAA